MVTRHLAWTLGTVVSKAESPRRGGDQADFYAVPGRENPGLHAGHYVAITGAGDGWSVYEVPDPADRSVP